MDEFDVASEREQEARDCSLAALRAAIPKGHGPSHCLQCGEPMPDVRRQHGYRVCTLCQEEIELRGKFVMRR